MLKARFRHFLGAAGQVAPGSPFHRLSLFSYKLLGIWIAALAAAFWLAGFSFGSSPVYPMIGLSIWVLMSALLARRYGLNRVALMLEALSLPAVVGTVTVVTTIVLAKYSVPLTDQLLHQIDGWFGFHWLALFDVYDRNPGMMGALNYAYDTFNPQIFLVPLVLVLARDEVTLWTFITAWIVASLATGLLFPFFPAGGPYLHFGIGPERVPELERTWHWEFGPLIERLQSGQLTDLSQAIMGIVSLPSFHAAAAVMYVLALRRVRWVWPVCLAVNAVLLFSIPVNGAHYLSDVIAGIALGLVSYWFATRLIGRADQATAVSA